MQSLINNFALTWPIFYLKFEGIIYNLLHHYKLSRLFSKYLSVVIWIFYPTVAISSVVLAGTIRPLSPLPMGSKSQEQLQCGQLPGLPGRGEYQRCIRGHPHWIHL